MINIKINKLDSEVMDFLVPKEVMHQDFWDEKVLLPEISDALMEIAQNVVESMEINAEIKDIIILFRQITIFHLQDCIMIIMHMRKLMLVGIIQKRSDL